MAESSHFVDLTHHLSPETLVRRANPLKDLIRVALENPHLVSLANGSAFFFHVVINAYQNTLPHRQPPF